MTAVCEAAPARLTSALFDDTRHSLLGSGMVAFNTLVDSTIDYSFAMWAPPRGRKSRHRRPPSCLRGTAPPPCYYYVDPCNDGSCGRSIACHSFSSADSVSSSSSRSVTFAEEVVTEVRSVPRYERESVPSLFYNRLDLQRFRHEAKLERMQVQVIW